MSGSGPLLGGDAVVAASGAGSCGCGKIGDGGDVGLGWGHGGEAWHIGLASEDLR